LLRSKIIAKKLSEVETKWRKIQNFSFCFQLKFIYPIYPKMIICNQEGWGVRHLNHLPTPTPFRLLYQSVFILFNTFLWSRWSQPPQRYYYPHFSHSNRHSTEQRQYKILCTWEEIWFWILNEIICCFSLPLVRVFFPRP